VVKYFVPKHVLAIAVHIIVRIKSNESPFVITDMIAPRFVDPSSQHSVLSASKQHQPTVTCLPGALTVILLASELHATILYTMARHGRYILSHARTILM
jgi:hypothetical protein